MKVALETGEVLEVAILDGDKVVGHLSLQLKGVGAATRSVGRPAGSKAAASSEENSGAGRRRKRKPMSPETRARMAEAQRRRWESNRKPEEESAS